MKHFLLLWFILCNCSFVMAQHSFEICSDIQGIRTYYQNDTVIINCDTIIVLNKNQFHLYEKARKYVLSSTPNHQNQLTAQYQKLIEQCEHNRNLLLNQLADVHNDFDLSLTEHEKALRKLQLQLTKSQKSLTDAEFQLNESLLSLKHQQQAQFRKNLIWGGSGTIVGLFLGLLLSQ